MMIKWIIFFVLLGLVILGGYISLAAWLSTQKSKNFVHESTQTEPEPENAQTEPEPEPENLGRFETLLVQNELGKDIEGVFRVLNNYRFVSEGAVREIDHIVISERGMFVIQAKNWSGDIYGGNNDKHWTQAPGNGKLALEHENPVIQNSELIHHLRGVFIHDFPEWLWLHSLVVFVQNNVEYIESPFVVPLSELKMTLNHFPMGQLNSENIERIYQALLAGRYKPSSAKSAQV